MAAPSLFDGVSRAVEEFGLPSVALLVFIGGIRVAYGGQEAGMIYVLVTVLILLGLYSKAKYWNSKYTLGVVVIGFGLWFSIPGIIPHLIPDMFANLGSLIYLTFLIGLAMMLTDKL